MRKASVKEIADPPFASPEVAAAFHAYPPAQRRRLLALRRLIFETAAATPGVGVLEESLKWGQPSYATSQTQAGSPIRIDQVKSTPGQIALYFHCQTDLVATFREIYPTLLKFGGNRSILIDDEHLPAEALRHCAALAMTYRLRKAARRRVTRS